MKATRKRYENISSLQKAFNKANKPKASDETKSQDEPKVQETESKTQDSPKSDTSEQPLKRLSALEVAWQVHELLDTHRVSLKDFTREFNSLYKNNSKKVA